MGGADREGAAEFLTVVERPRNPPKVATNWGGMADTYSTKSGASRLSENANVFVRLDHVA